MKNKAGKAGLNELKKVKMRIVILFHRNFN